METENYTPKPKVAAAGIAGSATVIVVWVAGMLGVDVPPEVAAALTVVVGFIAGYVKTS